MTLPQLDLSLDFRSGAPIYIQIMEQIQRKVAAGELKPGDQLPTVRHLATELRINFNTVARAYRLLDEESIISTQHGRGTYILEPTSEADNEELRRKGLERLASYFLQQAYTLGFSPEEVLALMEKKIHHWRDSGVPPSDESH